MAIATRYRLAGDTATLWPTRVLTPAGFVTGAGVRIGGGLIVGVDAGRAAAQAADTDIALAGDLVPGFIDLQVNGGGGVLFNDAPSVDGLATIAAAHRRFGTTGLLPTLISDDFAVIAQAIAAVDAAIAAGIPGILGIHIEGPFLNASKKGIHDAAKFAKLDAAAIDLLGSLRRGRTLVTLAPELAPPGAIRALVARGVTLAAGHSAASYEETVRALDEGMRGFTHLFNAMSQLSARAPGVVGAALDDARAWGGLIVDGHHVHPAALRVALAAMGPERVLLVTDAMPVVGGTSTSFQLGDRRIAVAADGCCRAADGTLAGSALDMAAAVRGAVRDMAVDLATAVRMASAVPARVMGLAAVTGAIAPGLRADLTLLDPDARVLRTWIAGHDDPAGRNA